MAIDLSAVLANDLLMIQWMIKAPDTHVHSVLDLL